MKELSLKVESLIFASDTSISIDEIKYILDTDQEVQPVTKAEIEQIRGVNSDYTIQKLLEKNLIEIEGRDDGPGRALIYSTSKYFMDYFGLKSMTDLPGYKDFDTNENSVGVEEEE